MHFEIAPIVKYLIDETERRGYLIDHGPADVDDDWSYANRAIRGRNTPSNHSWGLAIDINAQDFPLGSTRRLPQWLVDLFKAHGFDYGGDYQGRKDPMHFEFNGWPADARRIARAVGYLPPPGSVPPQQTIAPKPQVTAADLLVIQRLLDEDDDMIVIRNGKGIAHLVNQRTVLLNGPKALERVRKSYRDANKPLPELTLESDGEWTNYTGLR